MKKIAVIVLGCLILLTGCSNALAADKDSSVTSVGSSSGTASVELPVTPQIVYPDGKKTFLGINSLGVDIVIGTLQGNSITYTRTGNTHSDFQCDGEWIYYVDWVDSKSIYKVRLDGSELTKILDGAATEQRVSHLKKLDGTEYDMFIGGGFGGGFDLKLSGNTLYFTLVNSNQLAKINTDGSGFMPFASSTIIDINGSSRMNLELNTLAMKAVFGDWIYFVGNAVARDTLYKIKIDGTKLTKLCNSYMIRSLVVSDDGLYFNDEKLNFYRINTDGTDIRQLAKDVNSFIVAGDYAYAHMASLLSTGKTDIYSSKINLNTSEVTRITKDAFWIVDSIENWLLGTDSVDLYALSLDGKQRVKLADGSIGTIQFID